MSFGEPWTAVNEPLGPDEPGPPIQAPDGLISWWTGDGHADDVWGGNDGELVRGATYAPGLAGGAFSFDGVNGYVQAPTDSLPTGNADRTLELWMKVDAFQSEQSFLAGYGNVGSGTQTYQLGTDFDAVFFGQWGRYIRGPSLVPGQWYHVAVTSIGNSSNLYLNGQLVASSDSLYTNTPPGTQFYIGKIPGVFGDTRKFDGLVDEVSIYDRALTADEILSIYQAGSAGKTLGAPLVFVQPRSGLVTTEHGATAEFTVALTAQPTADVTVPLSSRDPSEGTVSPSSLVFRPEDWDSPQPVTVTGVDDDLADGTVLYTVDVGPLSSTDPDFNGLDPFDVLLANADDEVQPELFIDDVLVSEGGGGTSDAVFTVTLSDVYAGTITVEYTTADATAEAGEDYASRSGTLTFEPRQTTGTITVPVDDDLVKEPNETFFVDLVNPANATIGDGRGTATIADDDTLPPDQGWVIGIGNGSELGHSDMVLDEAGSIYATGRFSGTVDFDPGPGTAELSSLGILDGYLAKYLADGTLDWVRHVVAGADGYDTSTAVALDAEGNVYVTGWLFRTVQIGPFQLTSSVGYDAYVVKYLTDGTIAWVQHFTGHDVQATDIEIDGAGNLYVTGNRGGDGQFGSYTLPDHGDFLAKLSASSGEVLWAWSHWSHPYSGIKVAVGDGGDLYVAGPFGGSATFGAHTLTSAGGSDVFVIRMDPADAEILWAQRMGGAGDDGLGDMVLGGDGSPYVTGVFQGNADFGDRVLTSAGGTDTFVVGMSPPDGEILWATAVGGPENEFDAQAIATGPDGSLFLAGSSLHALDVDPGPGVSFVPSPLGLADAFVWEMNTAGDFSRLVQQTYSSTPSSFAVADRILVDGDSNVYVGGLFRGTFNFPAGTLASSVENQADAFLLKFLAQPKPNEAPVAVSDVYSSLAEMPLRVSTIEGVLLNDRDGNHDSLTVTPVVDAGVGPHHGALDLQPDGSFTYTPDPGYVGEDEFAYTASDGELESQASVRIHVQPIPFVEWRVEDGGNGHLYALTSGPADWQTAENDAQAAGGHLVTINDQAENDWLVQTFDMMQSYWIGLYQPPESPEPDGGWAWVSRETATYRNWAPGQPDDVGGADYAIINVSGEVGQWQDVPSAARYGMIEVEIGPPVPPTVSVNDILLSEGDGGTTEAVFTLTLSEPWSETITIDYATADGTTLAGEDYETQAGTVTFAPDETTQTITVLVNGDLVKEPNETFFVDLLNATNATILDGRGKATIADDDVLPPDQGWVIGIGDPGIDAEDMVLDEAGSVYVARSDGYLAKYLTDGSLDSMRQVVGGEDGEGRASAVTLDAEGSLYVAGQLYGTVQIGPFQLTSTGGWEDTYVVKYLADGTVAWVQHFTGDRVGTADVAVDGAGNLYLTGTTHANAQFGPFTVPNGGDRQAFVAKLDAATGDVLWAWGTQAPWASGRQIAVGEGGELYVAGLYLDASATFGSFTLTNGGYGDVFVIGMDPADAEVLWAERIGGAGDDGPGNMVLGSDGDLYLTGYFVGTADYGDRVLTGAGGRDYFAVKMSAADGGFQWADSVGGPEDDGGWLAIAAGPDNRLFLTGVSQFTVDVDPGPGVALVTSDLGIADTFVVEMDTAGNFSRLVERTYSLPSSLAAAGHIAVDADSNIYLTGSFTGTVNFPAATLTTSSVDAQEDFLLKIVPENNEPTALGTVDHRLMTGQDPSAGGLWYQLETAHGGVLTAVAAFDAGAGDATLGLYDAVGGTALAEAAPVDGGQRLDWDVQPGEAYYLQLAGTNADVDVTLVNLVQRDADITVFGTDGDDPFALDLSAALEPSPRIALTIHGVSYEFEPAPATPVHFDGGPGVDSVGLIGTTADDTLVLSESQNPLSLHQGEMTYVETLDGGTTEKRTLVTLDGVEHVSAEAGGGLADTALLYDSGDNDTFVSRPEGAVLSGPGDSYSLAAAGFYWVHAYGIYGGKDMAEFHDTPGADHFLGKPDFSWMSTPDYFHRAKFFEDVYAYSDSDSEVRDVAELRDSNGNDQFTGTPTEATMITQDQDGRIATYHAVGFFYAHGYGIQGGYDTAGLIGTTGNDAFQSRADLTIPDCILTDNSTYYLRAKKMDAVAAYESGGVDTAHFKDSPGDDVIIARPEWVKFAGPGHYSRVEGFTHVYGWANRYGGDRDTAQLYDWALQDLLEAGEMYGHNWARLSSNNAPNVPFYQMLAFDQVTAHAGEGDAVQAPDPIPVWLTIDGA